MCNILNSISFVNLYTELATVIRLTVVVVVVFFLIWHPDVYNCHHNNNNNNNNSFRCLCSLRALFKTFLEILFRPKSIDSCSTLYSVQFLLNLSRFR